MRLDRYTVRSQESLELAQKLARDLGAPELAPEHLLAALLSDSGGTVAAVLEKLGVEREPLASDAERAMSRLPRVQGGTLTMGEGLRAALERAETAADRLKDEYVSVEHLLMALAESAEGAAPALLARAGVTPDALLKALQQ
ncbi:MAG: Clp protease N-terminal domain-containing protein, partial [Candidatus Eiseniibacteriota bacterium]